MCGITLDFKIQCFGTGSLYQLPANIDYQTQYTDIVLSIVDTHLALCALKRDESNVRCWSTNEGLEISPNLDFGAPANGKKKHENTNL